MKNKFKPIIAILLIAVLLTSCSFVPPDRSYLIYVDPGYRTMEQILNAFEHKNSRKLKKLFSKEVRSEYTDFDQAHKDISEFFTGDVISVDRDASHESMEGSLFERDRDYEGKFIITTTNDTYCVYFYNYISDPQNPDNEGLHSLCVIKVEDEGKFFKTWDCLDIPGIFVGNGRQEFPTTMTEDGSAS